MLEVSRSAQAPSRFLKFVATTFGFGWLLGLAIVARCSLSMWARAAVEPSNVWDPVLVRPTD